VKPRLKEGSKVSQVNVNLDDDRPMDNTAVAKSQVGRWTSIALFVVLGFGLLVFAYAFFAANQAGLVGDNPAVTTDTSSSSGTNTSGQSGTTGSTTGSTTGGSTGTTGTTGGTNTGTTGGTGGTGGVGTTGGSGTTGGTGSTGTTGGPTGPGSTTGGLPGGR
jgi:hypothetical protein